MQEWTHERCGKTFSVPFDGAKNIPCEGCGVNVTIPRYGTVKITQGRKNGSKRRAPRNDWGGLQPQLVQKQPKFTSVFSSEIVKVGKTLTKHLTNGKLLRAVVYV